MDRDRYRKRAHDLHGCAQLIKDLTRVPDRATEADFRQVADLMTDAANDLNELIKATPPGCICRRIENDNYSYLDYAEGCLHHRQLYALSESLKADYIRMEKALKDEARMRLIAAALTGSAVNPQNTSIGAVKYAIAIADEALQQVVTEPKP